ncbi:transporter, major facilitator family protein [Lentilactobacillus parafarraginis F0439]|uniref:Transporter, major facilitator family protein n=1 Tax=Lentilactobacillus parafarraginis F0439 TaxID=797515 RepID=G9ZQD0_9LACO|nr:MFS transporter [Lentilactobacillus parafarraginis]EHL97573.1 transporter, major facilitator family protein [Lentilactobacillus parafarraginis F0439]
MEKNAVNTAGSNTDSANVKLSVWEKTAYSFTDMAGNLLYVTISSYILYFYTDVFSISVGGAGLILLVARFFDAVSAPVWGSIVDHTHTKWGQSRPYFLWLAIPFAVATFLAFTAPNLQCTAKLWYAGFTYILAAGVVYTGIQTPITAILPSLTTNGQERINANTFRMCGGSIGSFITSTFALPLVAFFGKGNDKVGFMWTMFLFGVLAVILLFLSFKGMKERTIAVQKPIPFKDSLKATVGNNPWYILVIAFVIYWVAQSTRNGISVYYAKYNLGNEQLTSVFNGLQVLGIIATMCIPFIVKVTNKTMTMLIGLAIGAFGQIMMGFVGNNFTLDIIAWIIGIFGASTAIAMPFGMLADTVDYGEWKTGIQAPGFLTAVGSAFCIQLGSGFGSFIPSKIMAAAGFVANKTQTPHALAAIHFTFIYLPVIIYAIVGLIMCLYFKYEKMEPQIKADLAKRHEQNA